MTVVYRNLRASYICGHATMTLQVQRGVIGAYNACLQSDEGVCVSRCTCGVGVEMALACASCRACGALQFSCDSMALTTVVNGQYTHGSAS